MAQSNTLLSGKRCLVLEDELLIALDLEQILEAAGAASVTCVSSADEALSALRSGVHFDIAVLDVLLRGATRTSRSVAAALHVKKIPFVFLTGMRGAELEAREFPAAPLVEKPYQPRLLLEALARALGAR